MPLMASGAMRIDRGGSAVWCRASMERFLKVQIPSPRLDFRQPVAVIRGEPFSHWESTNYPYTDVDALWHCRSSSSRMLRNRQDDDQLHRYAQLTRLLV